MPLFSELGIFNSAIQRMMGSRKIRSVKNKTLCLRSEHRHLLDVDEGALLFDEDEY